MAKFKVTKEELINCPFVDVIELTQDTPDKIVFEGEPVEEQCYCVSTSSFHCSIHQKPQKIEEIRTYIEIGKTKEHRNVPEGEIIDALNEHSRAINKLNGV